MTVHLLAGGTGDPDLWTVRAEHLLGGAPAIVCDLALVDAAAPLIPPTAEVVVVRDEHTGAAAVVALGTRLDGVVRLATGDRLLWEAGGVEADALRAAGIDVDVVPAVTVAFSEPATRGIPVMARQLAATLTVAVGVDAPPVAGGTLVRLDSAAATRATVSGAVAYPDLTGWSPVQPTGAGSPT